MSVHPERTYVVTGADSGIGALTARTLQERGARVIRCGLGVDVEVSADLGDDEGRAHLLREVERLAPGGIDGLALVAGLGTPTVETVRVNYFGTLSVLAGLRTRLRKKEAPRVVVVSSASSLTAGDPEVIEACLRGDEEAAVAAAERIIARGEGSSLYRSSKIALNRWVRQSATTDDWAGTGVPVNVLAPGIVATETARETMLSDPAQVKVLTTALPQPLGFPGPVQAVADALVWMIGPENSFMAGQIIYLDGGAEATLRGDGPYREGIRYGPATMARMIFYSLVSKARPRRER